MWQAATEPREGAASAMHRAIDVAQSGACGGVGAGVHGLTPDGVDFLAETASGSPLPGPGRATVFG
jgi:hypothetical protein